MEKIKYLLGIILLLFATTNVSAATNPYKKNLSTGDINCTWYAWQMAYERAGVVLPGWENAKTWYESAKNAGYQVGIEPKNNSIAVWATTGGLGAKYGHVGYVEKVSPDKKILYIRDSGSINGCVDYDNPEYQECLKNSMDEQGDRLCYEKAPKVACSRNIEGEDIIGYIYLDVAPKKPTTPPKKEETKSPVKPVEEKKKSSNNNLASLIIKDIEFEFNKEELEYKLEVEYEIDTIKIEAIPEDKTATVTDLDTYLLSVGKNEINIIVTAEDNTSKEYKLIITRLEKIKEEIQEEKIEEEHTIEPKKQNILPILLSISILIIIIITIGFIIWKKKKNNKDIQNIQN